ncbi:winged helix-turn-helix transcriptional regulator [Burkholderia gladioli]|uniref:winged helix-turn-helix transcriptional regulator n=1 Tax=Burkholderia gladioli TaxID=28095 RepID=UPI00163EB721|nr:helix-turn-helix domain-containing protein [Burkholderia gladioli]
MNEAPFGCGLEAVLELVSGKWKLLILFHLSGKRLRFSELRRLVGGVSEKMLSQQLKEMTRDGLVRRIDFQTVPPHVEYELEEFGNDLGRAIRPVCQWGTRNMDRIAGVAAAREEPAEAPARRGNRTVHLSRESSGARTRSRG